ncbi:MAG: iron-sulfur cluster assembly accessory protein [Bacteroidetes bacterium CG12_big_fil_rev_8_21_14_0_65_60_17]|nr:MAG: iron-sulfur cluster assembly accessory protein [Bacteroidetes bacterium CG12_big_fil_rev_8_21_14_0_65_60_17]
MENTLQAIKITDNARQRILATAEKEQVDTTAARLRIAVVPGGCSGLTYDLGWDTTVREQDEVCDVDGLPIVIDARSMAYLEGSVLDFSDGLQGKGFHFSNPQAVRNCACGESFGL